MTAHFDRVLDRIGGWKWFQIYHYILLGFAALPTGMHNLASVFLIATPEHWCHVPEVANHSVEEQRRLLTPPGELLESDHSCAVYRMDYATAYERMSLNQSHASNETPIVACTQWDYDQSVYGRTLVSEWDLVCSRAWLRALASSIYMLGFLIGTIGFGTLSDRIGRKPVYTMCMAGLVVSGSVSAFVPEYWSHVFIRMAAGISAAGAFTAGFVIVMEIIGKEKRMIPGLFYQGFFAVGYMILTFLAWLIRDHVWLNLTISLHCVIYLSLFWLIGESPRWLLARGRMREAEREIRRAARMNGVRYSDDLLEDDNLTSKELQNIPEVRNYHIGDLLRMPNMRKKTLNLYLNWFVNSFVYYGLSLGITDLAGDPYLNLFVSGIGELIGLGLAALTLDRLGRRWPLATLLVVGGTSCLIFNLIPPDYRIVSTSLAMIGKMCISGSFAVIYLFSAELFPTVVRNIGVGSGSMCARIGGLLAPFVVELSLVWKPLPMLIYGGSALLAGSLTLLLPETLHQTLPETLEEGEQFGRDAWGKCWSLPCKRRVAVNQDLDKAGRQTKTSGISL